jgi:hypothetical protein
VSKVPLKSMAPVTDFSAGSSMPTSLSVLMTKPPLTLFSLDRLMLVRTVAQTESGYECFPKDSKSCLGCESRAKTTRLDKALATKASSVHQLEAIHCYLTSHSLFRTICGTIGTKLRRKEECSLDQKKSSNILY